MCSLQETRKLDDEANQSPPASSYTCYRHQATFPPTSSTGTTSATTTTTTTTTPSTRDLYGVVKEACAQQNIKWPVECQVVEDKVHHIEDWPLYPEPFYEPTGTELRPQPVGDELGRVVYQYYPTSAVNYFSRSCVGGNKYVNDDVRPPLQDNNDTTLQFEARFECANLAKRDSFKSSVCRQRVLCRSLAGNAVYLLTITGHENDEGEAKKKRAVVLTCRVHPGETPSSWIMKGILDYLTADTPKAHELRCQFVFKIIPMLNPDGVIVGNHRCSLVGRDLNRQYKMVAKEMFPAIWHTKAMIRSETNSSSGDSDGPPPPSGGGGDTPLRLRKKKVIRHHTKRRGVSGGGGGSGGVGSRTSVAQVVEKVTTQMRLDLCESDIGDIVTKSYMERMAELNTQKLISSDNEDVSVSTWWEGECGGDRLLPPQPRIHTPFTFLSSLLFPTHPSSFSTFRIYTPFTFITTYYCAFVGLFVTPFRFVTTSCCAFVRVFVVTPLATTFVISTYTPFTTTLLIHTTTIISAFFKIHTPFTITPLPALNTTFIFSTHTPFTFPFLPTTTTITTTTTFFRSITPFSIYLRQKCFTPTTPHLPDEAAGKEEEQTE
ncbi:hypothetical protein Pmani_004939 [Petrolisthes manimaculis]|uniref:Peptidase M14 domain-containing protein n=1 Tax=Petrolisthes manimaculis TaxID=1843537 RepID=A0AAE1UH42_9EUCA|nr:hypothetical protein Pmani_004939 [Petrolisthes manimaculis]